MPSRLISPLTYLTADVPGVGGRIKVQPEDFFVEELPLYAPSGSGEHLYLLIEKRLQTTTDVIRRLAKIFNVRRGDIGYAGLKDKHAVTRQHFSIWLPDPSRDQAMLDQIQYTPIKLLWHARHGNKLRRGHLAGNRFVIRIREVEPAHVLRVRTVLDRLTQQGVPNFIGEQRFGYRQTNDIIGLHLLRGQWQAALDEMLGKPLDIDSPPMHAARQAYEAGDIPGALEHWPRRLRYDRQALDFLRQGKTPEQAIRSLDRAQLDFLLSSLQSALFNRVLDQRLRNQALGMHQLLPGDLAFKHDNGSVFAVDADLAAVENGPGGRVGTLAVSPSGPMWGANMLMPTGEALAMETAMLAEAGITPPEFAACPLHPVQGSRRSLRAILTEPDVAAGSDEQGPYIQVSFTLTKGSFATIALREMMKPPTELADDEEESEGGRG